MGVYTTTKCGNCGTAWESMSHGRHSACGPDLVKCSNCLALNKTGAKLFRDMNAYQKFMVYAGQTLSCLMYGLAGTAFGGGILIGKMGEGWGQLFGLIPLLFGLSQMRDLFFVLNGKAQAAIEKVYDENGGFIWSHQQY